MKYAFRITWAPKQKCLASGVNCDSVISYIHKGIKPACGTIFQLALLLRKVHQVYKQGAENAPENIQRRN